MENKIKQLSLRSLRSRSLSSVSRLFNGKVQVASVRPDRDFPAKAEPFSISSEIYSVVRWVSRWGPTPILGGILPAIMLGVGPI